MSFAEVEPYADLPAALRRLLDTAPLSEKKLLELGVTWPGLPDAQARTADLLRVFVITWDPLEHRAPRPEGFAAINVDDDGSELVVYLPIWSLVDSARAQHTTIRAVIGAMAGSAVAAAAGTADAGTTTRRPTRQGRAGEINDLLAERVGSAALGTPVVSLVSAGWEDIGLGAITDIVVHAFGPVDLDRAPVSLAAVAQRQVGCPACAGRRFGFPADLAESQTRMCPPHHGKADTVIRTRLARANASNPDGWAAIVGASGRLGRPHLPRGLATKLANAPQGMYIVPEPAELGDRARLVIEAAGWFPGRANDFAVALGAAPDVDDFLPDWLVNLVADLGRAGLGAEAVAVGDALTAVDPGLRSMLDADVAVTLAQAGLVDQARAKIKDNVTRWPDDIWIRARAGDALLALGDRAGAAAHFHAAVDLAEQTDDFEARSDAMQRLQRLERLDRPERRGTKPEPGSRPTNQRNQKAGGSRPGASADDRASEPHGSPSRGPRRPSAGSSRTIPNGRMNDWDQRLAWTFGLVADSPAQRQQAQQVLTQSRQRWAEALGRYNEVWNKPAHPEFRTRLAAFNRAHDFTYPHALWHRREGPISGWAGLPYAVLYLRWEAMYPEEWMVFKTGWGTKLSVLRDLAQAGEQLPPPVVRQIEDLVMMAVEREYRCEDVGYARLTRSISSPSLRDRLRIAAASENVTCRNHAAYLLWLLENPSLPHPKIAQWHTWRRQYTLLGD